MKVILCLGENNGMLFNKRRQSRDREVCADIARTVGDARLCLTAYSAPLFSEQQIELAVMQNPLMECADGDYCFIEDIDVNCFHGEIEQFVIYRWNRLYPADRCFNVSLSPYRLVYSEDFAGFSHEKITKEVWKK